MSEEVLTTSSTGGQKGVKLERYDLIPVGPLRELALHYGRGARKYGENQWRKGYEYSKSIAALQRHLEAFKGGEDIDEETGSPHMAAVAWHVFALLEFAETFPRHDDRWSTLKNQPAEEPRGFKVGDRVQIRWSGYYTVKVGDIGTVQSICDNGLYRVLTGHWHAGMLFPESALRLCPEQ